MSQTNVLNWMRMQRLAGEGYFSIAQVRAGLMAAGVIEGVSHWNVRNDIVSLYQAGYLEQAPPQENDPIHWRRGFRAKPEFKEYIKQQQEAQKKASKKGLQK